MCGLAGIIFNKNSWKGVNFLENNLKSMSKAIAHRGPNHKDIFIDENHKLGLCFQRLSILDLSQLAGQPMLSMSKDWIVVYNGEVYNFKKLKESVSRNHQYWRTRSDTEVIVENIDKYGFEKTISKLNGMFAIAAYCFSTGSLWLARDRFGEKPLYYSLNKSVGFFFSSEIKSLISFSGYEKKLNNNAVTNYLRYGYVPEPLSILEGTYKLEPGEIIKYDEESGIKKSKYWNSKKEFFQMRQKSFQGSYLEAKEEVKHKLYEVCKEKMISDVPIGTFLSGGIDSSNIVLALVSQGIDIRTFSVGFYDKKTNEAEYANIVAKTLNTKHKEIYITEKQCLDEVKNIVSCYDEPFADPSLIPTFLLSKFTKKYVTVALAGDGADEIFGGYDRYSKISNSWKKMKLLPPWLNTTFNKLSFYLGDSPSKSLVSLGKKVRRYGHQNIESLFSDEMSRWRPDENIYKMSNLGKSNFDERNTFLDGSISNYRYLMLIDILTYLPGNLLVKTDRASMFQGLEVRNPFLDHNLVKLVWSFPDNFLNMNNNKSLLRDILADNLPTNIYKRKKQGFEPPLYKWLTGDLKDWAFDILTIKDHFFDERKLLNKFEQLLKGEKKLTYKIWTIIMLKAWYHFHIKC